MKNEIDEFVARHLTIRLRFINSFEKKVINRQYSILLHSNVYADAEYPTRR